VSSISMSVFSISMSMGTGSSVEMSEFSITIQTDNEVKKTKSSETLKKPVRIHKNIFSSWAGSGSIHRVLTNRSCRL